MNNVDSNKIWIIDFETDNFNDYNRAFSASPHYPDNKVVGTGVSEIIVDPETGRYAEKAGIKIEGGGDTLTSSGIGSVKNSYPWLIVGHYVRFDLAHWRKDWKGVGPNPVLEGLKSGDILLWDTQFVEYLLSGQHTKMVSLNDLAKYYGYGEKVEGISELWDAGYKTRDIDPDMLAEYLSQDVELTKKIFLEQIIRASEENLLNFILVQLRSLFVVHEYEYNGMYVDEKALRIIQIDAEHRKSLAETRSYDYLFREFRRQDIQRKIIDQITSLSQEDVDEALSGWWDINSTDKLKRLVFGGPIEGSVKVENGIYKTGKNKGCTKYKTERFTVDTEVQVAPEDVPDEYLTPKGREHKQAGKTLTWRDISIGDESIKYISGLWPKATSSHLSCLMDHVSYYRDYSKLVGTYCKGITDYTFPDQCIHSSLNVDNTPTGRLTSSGPNLQNIPSGDESDFKKIFRSRFKDGKIGTVDFKQLEVVGLAFLTDDVQLVDDLKNGRNIHEETAKTAGVATPMTHDLRRRIKGVNFGTIYGAGVKKLTQQSGLPERTVQACVRALKERYPDAFGQEYIRRLTDFLDENPIKLGRDDHGMTLEGNYLIQPTGRKIWMETQRSDKLRFRGIAHWPYTKLRNYPVQSIAADIVSIARILFYETIRSYEVEGGIKMVNEVHDEIVFDISPELEQKFELIVQEVEDTLPRELERRFELGREFDLPLELKMGLGDNWKESK